MTGLARHLAKAGCAVTVLYTGGAFSSDSKLRRWRDRYRSIGITLEMIDRAIRSTLAGPVSAHGLSTPYLVYRHLRDRDFDVVNFNDCMGEGFYCLAMKRLGAAFHDTALFVGLHSPSQWLLEIGGTSPGPLLFGALNFAERLSIRLADLLWSPSLYLLDWTRQRGFEHPERTVVQPYVLPPLPLFPLAGSAPMPTGPRVRPIEGMPPREIVFFGRLEERKGLRLFCEAISRIEPELSSRNIAVTFLGKPGAMDNQLAIEFLEEAARAWRFPWKRISDLGQQEALSWLLSRSALAVIASPTDNSPCTVYEALAHGIPFIAARTGGIPELIADADRAACLFDCRPDDLAARLRTALERGVRGVSPAEAPDETRARWIGGFEAWADYVGVPDPAGAERRICVLLDGCDGVGFAESLASLEAADVSRVVLIARSGSCPDFDTRLPVTVVHAGEPNALATAIGEDSAEVVLMMRNGTVLSPGASRKLIQAFGSAEPDGLVPAATIGSAGKRREILPLGGSASFCLYEGAAPAGMMAVRAERLALATRGRSLSSETEFLGLADLAVAAGLDIWPYPEPLLHHPVRFVPERPGRSARERLAAYADTDATERFYIVASGYEAFAATVGLAGALRAIRQILMALGFGRIAEKLTAWVPARLRSRLRRAGRT